jgi:anaerobic selenocysteine-containing dehydrogenase
MPPELWHAAGESGPLPVHQSFSSIEDGNGADPVRLPDRRMTTSWPLRWELRAVDATRQRGWVWPYKAAAGPNPVRTLNRASPGAEESPPDSVAGGSLPLMLLVGRCIFDNGAMASRSPDLRPVTPKAFVELHPDEVAARGLVEGSLVTVTSPASSVQVALQSSTDTPRGAAYVAFDQPGLAANGLLSGEHATFVEVTQ